MSTKVQHVAYDFVQIAGYITAAAAIPGIGTLNPWVGTIAGLLGAVASYLKTNVVGNITASTPTPKP